jgi:hypothetical protein
MSLSQSDDVRKNSRRPEIATEREQKIREGQLERKERERKRKKEKERER